MSQRAYAKHRGVSHIAVQKAIRTGRITTTPDGMIEPARVDAEWEQNTAPRPRARGTIARTGSPAGNIKQHRTEINTEDATTRVSVSYAAARAIRETFLAKLSELEYKRERGELRPIGEINAYVSGMIIRARDILLRIGPELCDRLAQESDAIKCEALITAEIHRSLRELAEYRPPETK